MTRKNEDEPHKRRRIKQHQTLFNPEYNFNHKVIQKKKHKMNDKMAKKEVQQFLGTKGECDDKEREAAE